MIQLYPITLKVNYRSFTDPALFKNHYQSIFIDTQVTNLGREISLLSTSKISELQSYIYLERLGNIREIWYSPESIIKSFQESDVMCPHKGNESRNQTQSWQLRKT